jgi:ATP-dependent helicase/nuclease subunit A
MKSSSSTRKNRAGPRPLSLPADLPLVPDTELRFPNFVLVKASAGSGKTHALSLWYVQLLLSEVIKKKSPNDLRNILAITFTRNAAREMKSRILGWLKDLYFEEEDKTAEVLSYISPAKAGTMSRKAASLLDDILSRYTDFQVETIDSFMAAVFKASALDLGVPPHFEILLDNSRLLEYAFSRYLRRVTPRSSDGEVFVKIAELISASQKTDDAFPWDPSSIILEKITKLQAALSSQTKPLDLADLTAERREVEKRIGSGAEEVGLLIEESGLELNARSTLLGRLQSAVQKGRFVDLLNASFRTLPVKKPRSAAQASAYERLERIWRRLEALVREYQVLHARQVFRPYLLAFHSFAETLETVKRRQEVVFIEDIPKRLSAYIEAGIVPDIYFRLGDRVFHYLIDEFQDTSPIQWANLRPLIENSLALNGSLFVVGDTKQAIYGFREADFRIMRALECGGDAFPSARAHIKELKTNYRSLEEILAFVRDLFLKRLPGDPGYGEKGALSGLTDFDQEVKKENRGQGLVTFTLLDKKKSREEGRAAEAGPNAPSPDDWPEEAFDEAPEKKVLQERIRDLRGRGYAYSDIAILTYKNESVVNVSSWLNEAEPPIPFIPYSSLDIRTRKVTLEIVALLKFLDSPPDELAFVEFLLSSVLGRKLEHDGRSVDRSIWHRFIFQARQRGERPLYVAFRNHYPALWEACFERLFRLVGYTPLYDLAALAYATFDVFRLFPEEEATLAKLLETIKDFEAAGKNDLGEFLELASQREMPDPAWNIEVPLDIDAVRVMSIHKAKGLQFPVVLLLQYGQRFIPPDFYLDLQGEAVRVLKLNQHLAEADPRFREVYDEERERSDVDRLNTLYVALTRAKAELHIIGVRNLARTPSFPFNLLDESLPPRRGRPPVPERRPEPPVNRVSGLRFAGLWEAPPGTRAELTFRNVRRGIFLHDLLARLVFLEKGWEARLTDLVREAGQEADWASDAEETLTRFLSRSPLRAYFERKGERSVLTEFNICDASGRLHRLDRLVVDPEGVTVLDFKTGDPTDPEADKLWDEDNRAQMRLYLRIVADIFPGRRVRGILAYVDRGTGEEVE